MLSYHLLLEEFKNRVFQNISLEQDDLLYFFDSVREKKYPRKSFLLMAGDKWDNSFYIHRGLIRLFYTDMDGREFNKAFFWEGHCIWPVAPRDRNENVLVSVAAMEEVTVFEFAFQQFHDLLKKSGNWEKFAIPFAETLVEQKFQREHDFLLLSATERFKIFAKTHPDIICRIPDYHLASFLGITNVSLSRIKRQVNV